MNRAAAFLWILFAMGCSTPKPETVTAESKPLADDSATAVELDAAAQKEAGIVVQAAGATPVRETLHATGRITLNENRTWRVGAVTEGRIVKVYVNTGDPVKPGQVLARMHSHDVHEGRAEYRKALQETTRATAAEAFATKVRDRARRLYELKAGSLEQAEHAEAELRNAQAALAQAKLEMERARTHLVDFLGVAAEEPEHHAAGEHQEDDADLIPVRAPAGGTLLERKVTLGTVVEQSAELFSITDLTTLWMIAAVSEESMASVRPGTEARIKVHAHPGREFPGRVARLGTELDPVTRTIQARIDLPNRQALLKPEMYAEAEFRLARMRSAVSIPETAMQELKGQQVVFLQRGPSRFEAQVVETGRSNAGRIEITRGLQAGDQVVVSGGFLLKSQLLKSALAEGH